MRRDELFDLIKNGEDSGVEFKRDSILIQDLAKELVSFLNLDGGVVLLGVEDDGSISGTDRDSLEEWVATACRDKIAPPIVPYLSWVKGAIDEKDVLVARVPPGLDKPYALVHNSRSTYFIRVGSTCREASREELERLFQASGRVRYGLKPVPGSTTDDLDGRRLRNYFEAILGWGTPDSDEALVQLLLNLDLATHVDGTAAATVDGMILFGSSPKRLLPQSGIRAISYPGRERSYSAIADEELTGPLLPIVARDGAIVEPGLVEQALAFVKLYAPSVSDLSGGRRAETPAYPAEALRESIVNALVHRDYSIAGSDVMIEIFSDRLEVTSPGRLPNSVTVEGMRTGLRYSRNQILVNVMRDYRYLEARGMGVRFKIIPSMRDHNGTEPEFVSEESRFTVRLWRTEDGI